jgi:hypothetical protein
VGKYFPLGRIDDVGGGRQKAAGLAFEREVLGVELPGGKQTGREKAADVEFVNKAKIHFFELLWSAVSRLR